LAAVLRALAHSGEYHKSSDKTFKSMTATNEYNEYIAGALDASIGAKPE